AFDYEGEGPEVAVAVVAQETLDQAEDFAVARDFRPVSFVAIPPDGAFTGEPMFGQTRQAPAVLGRGKRLERDSAPIVVLGAEPDADAATVAPEAAAEGDIPEAGFQGRVRGAG
ncbi:MAG: translation initiation factor 2, partial [Rhodobacteraceae bacterium]|nr:translation initiation factor 2 [Paracoccaceae bacterium]